MNKLNHVALSWMAMAGGERKKVKVEITDI